MTSRSKNIASALFGLWGGLGAYRGHQFYNKDYQPSVNDGTYRKEPKYYFFTNAAFSVIGSLYYMIPLLAPISIYYELHNLEDFIRGRDDK